MAGSIALARARSEAPSLDEVFRAQGGFVLRTVRRLGAASSDAEDLAQQVFLVLHRRPELLAGNAPVRSVLFGIVRRVVADYRKRARRVTFAPLHDVPSAPDQESALDRKDAREMLERALEALDQKKREVFVLYELEELEMPEVAAILGVPAQTAYTRLHAARAIVRRILLRKERR
jgi:RNA polymerase sigma-70 factor, ECF subfamily